MPTTRICCALINSHKFCINKYIRFLLNPIGFGTWSWGNEFLFNYRKENDPELQKTYEFLRQQSNIWFDTAEVYGKDHRSETLLGQFGENLNAQNKPVIFTKCAPQPQRIGNEVMFQSGLDSAKRLQVESLDVLQLHWPPSPSLWQEEEYLNGMVKLVDEGKCVQLGVSNYGPKGLMRVRNFVDGIGGRLYSNQVQSSLLYQETMKMGLLDVCKKLDIQPIAYSPLALGLLTDKYSEDNLPKGPRSILFREYLPSMRPLLGVLREIAKNKEKTVAQVYLFPLFR